MNLFFTSSGYCKLALAAALTLPGLAAAQQSTPTAQALTSFSAKAKGQNRLSAADVANPNVTSSYFDASTGLTHTYLQQRVNGLAIFNATGAVHTDRNGKAVLVTQDFVPDAASLAPSASPAITPEQAIVQTAAHLNLPRPVGLRKVVEARGADGIVFNKGGISENNIPVRLMYTRVGDKLVLVWNVTIAQLDQQHHWNARIDAQTGRLVDQNDYTVSEQATSAQHNVRPQAHKQKAPAFRKAGAMPGAKRGALGTAAPYSVTVYSAPLESPSGGARQVVPLAPAGSPYSPYGWQVAQAPANTFPDSYSKLSSGKFLTRGNNVAAYDDYNNTANGPGNANYNSATSSPDGGPTLDFDFPFVQPSGARANLNAAITNLFYWNNIVHDVMMAHGFDEVSGNFQYKNATGKGAATDPVRAEAQDGFDRGNANFSTPPDGSSGLMQMYLWDNSADNALTITAPSAIAGTYRFGTAGFGVHISKLPNGLCGKIVVVNDGVSADNGAHSCASPYVNAAAMVGNIALIMRGGCTAPASNNFSDKVKFAQENGAIGAIIFDSNPNATVPLSPGGEDATVTIPVIGISGVDGARIQAALTGSTVGMGCAKSGPDFDASFDNGIIAHEYGHGISNRLTGGPANSSCVTQTYTSDGVTLATEAMGEGWSDFFALWMTTNSGDTGNSKRFVGTYASAQTPAIGPGIRSYPYTTDIKANPLTYDSVGTRNYSQTHRIGEVWASVLWDLNWQFIKKYSYNTDVFSATGGNNKMLKLVLDGCKLQVCNPGFLDGRDALLRADSLTNRAANAELIWNVFARRGMGFSAVQGERVNGLPYLKGIRGAYDLPPAVKVIPLTTKNGAIAGSTLEAYPNPAQDQLTVRTQLSSNAPIQVMVMDLLGKTVVPAVPVPAAQMRSGGVQLNTSHLASGLYVVRVTTTEGTFTTKVTIQH